jgi:hypothetical protein
MSEEQINLLTDNINSCRICLEEEENIETLINPCKCSGSSNYVHVSCLQDWIRLSHNPEAKKKCMECKTDYNFIRNDTVVDIFIDITNLTQYLFNHMGFCTVISMLIDFYDFSQNYKIINYIFKYDANYFTDYDILNFIVYFSFVSYINNIGFLIFYFYKLRKTNHCFYIKRDLETLFFQFSYQISFPIILYLFLLIKEYFGFFMILFFNIFIQPNAKLIFIKSHKQKSLAYNNDINNIQIIPYDIETGI